MHTSDSLLLTNLYNTSVHHGIQPLDVRLNGGLLLQKVIKLLVHCQTKQKKKPTLEPGFCFKQNKNKSQKATKRITSLLYFFITDCLTETNTSFLVLTQKVCWVSNFFSIESDAIIESVILMWANQNLFLKINVFIEVVWCAQKWNVYGVLYEEWETRPWPWWWKNVMHEIDSEMHKESSRHQVNEYCW